jgi:hypothetical protein
MNKTGRAFRLCLPVPVSPAQAIPPVANTTCTACVQPDSRSHAGRVHRGPAGIATGPGQAG